VSGVKNRNPHEGQMTDSDLTKDQRKYFESKHREISNDVRYHRLNSAVSRRLPTTKEERAASRLIKSAESRRRRVYKMLSNRIERANDKVRQALLFGKANQIRAALKRLDGIKL
jgi:hypothetical protein